MKITIFFLARTIESWVKWMLIVKGRFSKGYVAQSSKFCLRQQLFAFKEFYMDTRLSNIFKTTNVTNFTKAILKSSYRVLEVTFKWKTLKQPVYFFKNSWILLYFWLYFGKSCKTAHFRKAREVSQTLQYSCQ